MPNITEDDRHLTLNKVTDDRNALEFTLRPVDDHPTMDDVLANQKKVFTRR